jgi:hypothetical protein
MDAILVPVSPARPPPYRAAQHLWRQYARHFRNWRGLRPREWRAGRIRGYKLRFNLKAPPRGTITYANLSADPNAEVWGVLYKITRRDLVRLEATEGVPWWRYRPLWLDAEDLGGTAPLTLDRVIGQRQTERPSAIFPRAVLLSALALRLVPQSLRVAGDVDPPQLEAADSEPHFERSSYN